MVLCVSFPWAVNSSPRFRILLLLCVRASLSFSNKWMSSRLGHRSPCQQLWVFTLRIWMILILKNFTSEFATKRAKELVSTVRNSYGMVVCSIGILKDFFFNMRSNLTQTMVTRVVCSFHRIQGIAAFQSYFLIKFHKITVICPKFHKTTTSSAHFTKLSLLFLSQISQNYHYLSHSVIHDGLKCL